MDIKAGLFYSPLSGLFYRETPNKLKVAGSLHKQTGYVYIGIKNKKYLAHRLAVYFMTGKFPQADVDHRNGNRSDNKFSNLRICERYQNLANSNLSFNEFPRGVQRNGKGYMARIRHQNNIIYIGTYKTPSEASYEYKSKRAELLREFEVESL